MKDSFLENTLHIFAAARASDDGQRCAVSMSPEAREKLKAALASARGQGGFPEALSMRASEPRRLGFNDGVIIPPDLFPIGTSPSRIAAAAADRAPLRGVVRIIVVLVDFTDKHMAQTAQHFRDLFFGQGGAKPSVRDYYAEVTNGLIDIQGDVVGPFRMPQTLAAYAHGASGIGNALPNAQTMASDALTAANPTVNFTPFDNDGNGFVDAFIVVHAGTGAETNSNPGDIWSHKWTLSGGARNVDSTKVFAYLTVPEDCRIGVCAHELGHLLFGFPDLYDTDNSSEGIGNWCLMAGGSWGAGGDAPTHPCAWCKANQEWVQVDNRTANGVVQIPDVKSNHTVHRLWKDGAASKEYFLVENRQKTGAFDVSLPGSGLLIWHIDENMTNNRDENHYWVALMQADGLRQLEDNTNRGDPGDCWPGSTNKTNFTNASTPNSKSYAGQQTCVAVTGISPSAAIMSANLQVKCGIKPSKEFTKEKELAKELRKEVLKEKEIRKDFVKEKELRKEVAKDFIDEKSLRLEKRPDKTLVEGKLGDGKLTEGRPGGFGFDFGRSGAGEGDRLEELRDRVSAIEAALSGAAAGGAPFIGSELRPDLSQGALSAEALYPDDQSGARMAPSKRLLDSGPG
ncbi:MAG TPA: M6 family metalloprotease domain-containing protein [Steroidobacteraceae bacterium]